MSPVNEQKLNRRALLLGTVFLVGGATALTRFTRKPAPGGDDDPALSADQFALLEQVSEVIIPATDTPGAIGAGVPVFIRDMLGAWASKATRNEIVSVLDAIEKTTWTQSGAGFRELLPPQRLALMADFDAARIAAQDPAYRKFKWLVMLGYYHSEIGASHELRFELVPGAWRACLPLTEVGRASATY